MTAEHSVSCPDCGWTAQSDTAGRAAHRLKRHTPCPKPETVRECTHGGKHVHGTVAAYYGDRCKCRQCRAAGAAYKRKSVKAQILGRPLNVDVGPARAHLTALRTSGIRPQRAAELAGIPYPTVAAILRLTPPRTVCRRATAAAILSVAITEAAPRGHSSVDPTGSRRRLQALAAIGWAPSRIALHSDLTVGYLTQVMHGRKGTGDAARRAITDLYNRLWKAQPPSATQQDRARITVAKKIARTAGWVVPQYWDDDEIDNPKAAPRVAVAHVPKDRLDIDTIEQRIRGDNVRLSREERLVVSGRLRDVGYSARQIAARVERTERQVQRDLAEIEANATRAEDVA